MKGDPTSAAGPRVVALDPGDPRAEKDLYPLLRELRPALTSDYFIRLLNEGYPQGLRYLVAYAGDGAPLGAAGYRVMATSRGRVLYLDDLVTRKAARSGGVGGVLLAAVKEAGHRAGCVALELDSGTGNVAAHRFYFRHRMSVLAFHFAASLAHDARTSTKH
jgi:GNAT superfamily N-acetyltransferase